MGMGRDAGAFLQLSPLKHWWPWFLILFEWLLMRHWYNFDKVKVRGCSVAGDVHPGSHGYCWGWLDDKVACCGIFRLLMKFGQGC